MKLFEFKATEDSTTPIITTKNITTTITIAKMMGVVLIAGLVLKILHFLEQTHLSCKQTHLKFKKKLLK